MKLRKRLHDLFTQVMHQHTEPTRMALAVFIGCVVGCTPLFGFHLPLCIAIAWLFGLNQLVVYGAANLSVPPLIPFIGFASVQLGERVLRGHFLAVDLAAWRADFNWESARALAHRFFFAWLVGGALIGAAVGATAGLIVFVLLHRRRPPDEIEDAIRSASSRYRNFEPRFKWYARFKYRMDPCYRAIAPLIPEGSFAVDLGTGLGMLPVLLGVLGGGRRALGIEWDAGKVACARRAAAGLVGIEAVEGDVREFPLPACDVITLVDMLHYYDAELQREILQRCRTALRVGGRLLVREGDRSRGGGARWTRLVEWCATRFGWNKGPAVRFRPLSELRDDLESLGFTVAAQPVSGPMHPGNVLLVAERA